MGAIAPIIQSVEQAQTSGDGHTHNFDKTYTAIVQLQHQDAASPQQFTQDMAQVNQKLHAEGLLTNLTIVGVDEAHHKLITQDIADHRTVAQDPSRVNDYGALGSGGNGQEGLAGLVAKGLGVDVSRNGDGSYNVKNPLDDPNAAAKIVQTVLNGLLGGDSGSGANSAPLGMPPLMAAAWRGFPEDAAPDPPAAPDAPW
jgi:hypothetical protein